MEVVGKAFSFIHKLFSELQHPELKELFSIYGYESKFEKLQSIGKSIKAVLHSAETIQELPAVDQEWIKDLEGVIFKADDLLDEFVVALAQQTMNAKADGITISKISLAKPFDIFDMMFIQVEYILTMLDNFTSKKEYMMESYRKPIMNTRFPKFFKTEPEDIDKIVGREVDLERIVGKLLDSDVQDDVSFLSIVGIGGIGKTALAKLIYNDKRVKSAFSLREWTCVPDQDQKLDVHDLSSHQNHITRFPIAIFYSQLISILSHEKYLLILDNVNWTEDRHQLDDLVRLLKVGKKGSWIVVTTRSEQTAKIMGCDSIYKLQGLDQENSWSLFKKVAYDSEHSYPLEDPEDIGEKIVNACAGVPLALRVAGSLFYGQDMNTKQAVVKKFGEADMISKDGISQLLKLNYQFLPSTLKNCFSYCAIFPKNCRMEKNMLISIWMAHNYIVPLYEGQSIEDAGEEYFSILLRRCFFHDIIKDKETGEVLAVKMLDLLYDIAQYVSRNEIFAVTTTISGRKPDQRVRHLSISNSSTGRSFPLGRTHIGSHMDFFEYDLGKEGGHPYVKTLVDSCTCLRTLRITNLKYKYLPSSIGRLLHLRYLDLSYNHYSKVLPSSITELCYLETLILNNCSWLRELPKDLSRLTKLRVLDISGCNSLEYMPKNMSNLTCIKRLSDFIVGVDASYSSWKEGFLGLEELKDLNKLEGALNIMIKFPEYVANLNQRVPDQQKGMYLRDKNDLNRIAITFDKVNDRSLLDDAETIKLMEDLQAPPNLKILNVDGYHGTKMPKWISFFPCLVTLKLKYCFMLEYLETSGNGEGIFLPNLRTLELICMLKLKGWSRGGVGVGVEESSNSQLHLLSSLPRLENLTIKYCPELMCFPLCHEVEIVLEYPKLRYVQIDDVAWLNSLPTEAFRCLETLEILKDEKVKYLGKVEKVFRACSASLRFLKIRDCSELRSVFVGGLEHLSALEKLKITNCGKLELLEQKKHPSFLPSLHTLKLEYLPTMLNLPNWMQFLPTIQTLEIHHCKNLKAIPNWMSKLTNLKKLIVKQCSERLERRCKIKGKDRPFIQHIPTIIFKDYYEVSTSDYETDDETNTSTVESIPQLDGKSLPKTTGNRWLTLSYVFKAIYLMKVVIPYQKREESKLEELKLHCSIFPSGYEFEREKLIQLWMAVGFIKTEEVGNIKFDVLVEQNCILLAGTDILTGKNKYKVDLDKITSAFNGIRSIKNEDLDNVFLEDDQNMTEDESKFWHISVVSDRIDQKVFEGLKNFRELRTLLFTRNYGSSLKQVPSDMFIALQSLQALDLSGAHLVELPSSVGNLVFLRYLNLSFTLIKSLPESIDCLRELQTLKLEGCKHIYKLPNGMKELIKLRYLELDVLGQLTYMPKEIGKLIELRTLSAFIVKSEEGCSIRELKNMNNLRGHFCISGLENASSEEIEQANIKDKIHITRLQLRWNDSHCVQECGDYSSIVHHLMPNYQLEELQILHYPAHKLPKWIGFSDFVKLVSIIFINCAIEELNITLGMLPNLKHVQIIQMNRLVVIDQGIHNSSDGSRGIFPKLETLSIEGMSSLECWRDTKDGDFPLLSKLIIEQCPKLTELPFLPYLQSLNHLKISDCTTFQALPEGKLSSSLQTLAIDGCPLLEKRCNDGCEDWQKIEHVPNILINMNDVRSEHEEDSSSDYSDDLEDSNGQIQLDNNHH
ncbi:unnamed protein product [Amaranthus hypochondriacus]